MGLVQMGFVQMGVVQMGLVQMGLVQMGVVQSGVVQMGVDQCNPMCHGYITYVTPLMAIQAYVRSPEDGTQDRYSLYII